MEIFSLTVEAGSTSEASVKIYQTTQHNHPEKGYISIPPP
jgi:hypothetical protein